MKESRGDMSLSRATMRHQATLSAVKLTTKRQEHKKDAIGGGKRKDKRRLNKFRRCQLKQEEVLTHNRFGGYWA